jgi:hypothetical protein
MKHVKNNSNLVEVSPGHFRDLSLHKDAQAEKTYGFNWRRRIRRFEAEKLKQEEAQARKAELDQLVKLKETKE